MRYRKPRRTIGKWIASCFLMIFLACLALSGMIGVYNAHKIAKAVISNKATSYIGALEAIIRRHGIDALNAPVKSEKYQSFFKDAKDIIKPFDVEYAYVYSIRFQPDPARYYLMVYSPNVEKDAAVRQLVHTHSLNVPVMKSEIDALSGAKGVHAERIRNRFGEEITCIMALSDDAGEIKALIGMDFSIREERRLAMRSLLGRMITFAFSLSAGLAVLLILVQRRIALPIRRLSERMKSFSANRQSVDEPLFASREDEIADIADSFKKMSSDIASYIGSIEELTRERLETAMQIDIAGRIQNDVVPSSFKMHEKGISICAASHPAKDIGGDFYDCFKRSENEICITIGDVSGKGISAAFLMAMVRTALREKLLANPSPSKAFRQINDELCHQSPEGMFITSFAGVFDIRKGELKFSNAGHTSPVLFKNGSASFLKVDSGIALGLFDDAALEDDKITIPDNSGILLYSDGITEAVNKKKAFFGANRLLTAISCKPCAPMASEMVKRVLDAVKEFQDGAEAFDDMTILALSRGNDDDR